MLWEYYYYKYYCYYCFNNNCYYYCYYYFHHCYQITQKYYPVLSKVFGKCLEFVGIIGEGGISPLPSTKRFIGI